MEKKPWIKYLPVASIAVVIFSATVLLYLVRDVFEKPVQSKKQVQSIKIIQPPPPPPPPPPEQKPSPPEVKEEIEEPKPEPKPEPEQQAEEPPPGDQLGVDAQGGAGGDAFGLMGKKGGHGLIGGGGNSVIYYGQQLQKVISDQLQRSLTNKAKTSQYSAILHLWINPEGNITKVELAHSSGTVEIDEALKTALGSFRGQFKPPPERMPQPVKIRVRSQL